MARASTSWSTSAPKGDAWSLRPQPASEPDSKNKRGCPLLRRSSPNLAGSWTACLSAAHSAGDPDRPQPETAAPPATTTAPASAPATATAPTGLSGASGCSDRETRNRNRLEDVDPHHRDCGYDVRHSLETFSTRHASCHSLSFLLDQTWMATPAFRSTSTLQTGNAKHQFYVAGSLTVKAATSQVRSGGARVVPIRITALDEREGRVPSRRPQKHPIH
jgi:hypothetical protein